MAVTALDLDWSDLKKKKTLIFLVKNEEDSRLTTIFEPTRD